MNYASIKFNDIANGPGVRTSLFVSGCNHHCEGCFNSEAWDFNYGKLFDDDMIEFIISSLDTPFISGLTILGGEPLDPNNQEMVAKLVKAVRDRFGSKKNIWCYTGYVYEPDVKSENGCAHTKFTNDILENIDVLVDGPFKKDLYDISLKFRGSSNQRIINL